ncbi:hypothetical protein F4810DRAFT_692850 [Camillea tinctor]|nr:hypothetical protein F4810DRAFT_692850 [Camillea tinctor]
MSTMFNNNVKGTSAELRPTHKLDWDLDRLESFLSFINDSTNDEASPSFSPNSDRPTWEQPPGVAQGQHKFLSNPTPATVNKKGTAQPSDPLVPVRTWPNALTAFTPIRKPTLVSKSLWYNLETLGNQYPDKNIFRGLKYRTTILKSIELQVSDPVPLDMNNVLYKGVTPIVYSVSLPHTLNRANDLQVYRKMMHFGEPPDQRRVWHRAYQKSRLDIEEIAGIKMLPPEWFERKRYFTDRAAELKGIGIHFGKGPSNRGLQFWNLDPLLWHSDLAEELFGELDSDVSERTPLDQIQKLDDIDLDIGKLRVALDRNRRHLYQSQLGPTWEQIKFSQLRFKNEILWRCCYINEFMSRVRGTFKEGEGEMPSFYPFLGPNVELDIWLFANGIIRTKEADFDIDTDILTRMYGFGQRELKYLSDSQNTFRRRELGVLERFHMLQGCLGFEATRDIAEQLKYCFYAVRNTRNIQDEYRYLWFWDRRREFAIAAYLVRNLWENVDGWPQRTMRTVTRENRGLHGEWFTLCTWDRLEILRHDSYLVRKYLDDPPLPPSLLSANADTGGGDSMQVNYPQPPN